MSEQGEKPDRIEQLNLRRRLTFSANQALNTVLFKGKINEAEQMSHEDVLLSAFQEGQLKTEFDQIDLAERIVDSYALVLTQRTLTPEDIQASGLTPTKAREARKQQVRAELDQVVLGLSPEGHADIDPIIQGLQQRLTPPPEPPQE